MDVLVSRCTVSKVRKTKAESREKIENETDKEKMLFVEV